MRNKLLKAYLEALMKSLPSGKKLGSEYDFFCTSKGRLTYSFRLHQWIIFITEGKDSGEYYHLIDTPESEVTFEKQLLFILD